MEHEIAQLRHLYAQMVGGVVKDSDGAKRIAEGLLSPVIQKLERLLHGENESIKLEATPVAYMYHDAEDAHSANPMLHSTMLVFACDRRTGYANETPLYTVSNSAAKQIEALHLALKTERGATNLYAQQVAHWMSKHDEKIEQIEALQSDADRYRWLRNFHAAGISDNLPHIAAGGDYIGAWTLHSEEADKAIDAARARLGEGVSDD